MSTKATFTMIFRKISILVLLLMPALAGYSQSEANSTKTPAQESSSKQDSTPMTWVQIMPKYPGGDGSLIHYIAKHIKYPKYARRHNIQGRVIVRFIVDVDGKVKDANVPDGMGIGGGCDEEAIRVIMSLPNWTPGTQQGVPVPVWYTVPIIFKLQ